MGLFSGIKSIAGDFLGTDDLASAQRAGSRAQAAQIEAGIGDIERLSGEAVGRFEPFAALGQQFMPELQQGATIEGFGQRITDIGQSPAFQAILNQAAQGAQEQLAASGLSRSGRAADLSSQARLNALLGIENQITGRAGNLMNTGLTSTGNIANILTNQAAQTANLRGQLGATQAAGIIGPAQTNAAAMQSLLNLGGQIGGAAMMASDERLKTNIEPAGSVGGFNLYNWDWVDGRSDPTFGVIAQEVQKTHPQLVNDDLDYLRVDYSGLLKELGVY